MTRADDLFESWLADLERRHLADRTFAEVRKGVQALSAGYVEGRERGRHSAALSGSGKRAGFALFYGPLHFLTVRGIVEQLGAASPAPSRIVDLGCGSGAAGAAWALACDGKPSLTGIERHPWAVAETR